MSLTLNDEQEKALRDWYNMDSSNSWKPDQAPLGLRLRMALDPLFRDWRVAEVNQFQVRIESSQGIVTGQLNIHAKTDMRLRAQELCDVMNKGA